jgi:hypothetical protein
MALTCEQLPGTTGGELGNWLHSGAAVELDRNRTERIRGPPARFHASAGEVLAAVATGRPELALELSRSRESHGGAAIRPMDALMDWLAAVSEG